MAEKSYRIRTNIGEDKVVQTSLSQDIEFLEILSLKLNQKDTYKLHVSNYGIIVGRVLANDAFGIPNAKVSIFIKLKDEDKERSEIVNLYPYKTLTTKDKNGKRYNLLSDSSNDVCHRIVGTFPNKRLVLDNDTEIEIYEKYWKYTTVTNQSGDFMIFGVPTGNQQIHVDIDLSDIGILSQKPRDFYYKGYNQEQFDNAEQFKEGNNLENLTQLLSQETSVYVYPFFGDSGIDDIAITRCDVQIPYKFEPTCVFFGSIISDKPGQHIGHKCGPSRWVGYNRNLVTGEGTIEMIRRTPDGLVEEFPIKGNRLIDGDGVWCYQIPMNLDYIGTDEFGNIIPVQDSTKGIPTRTSVRFRISMQETKTEASTEHVAKYLVPNIHELDAKTNRPKILNGNKYNLCYEFGSATPKEYFRDLLWNKVYTVKNYIPRFEHRDWVEKIFSSGEKSYTGIRSVSTPHSNNVFPFNSARFHLRFTYRLLCLLMIIVITIISFYNKLVSEVICWQLKISFRILGKRVTLNFGRPLKWLSKWIKCIGLKGGMFFEERGDTYYFPKCDKDCGSIINSEGLKVNKSKGDLEDVIQQTLALEYELVNLDFHNDWINGTLYLPLWFWKKRAKKKFLFGLFSRKAVNTFCSCEKTYDNLKLTQGCSTIYNANFSPVGINIDNDKNRHREYDKRQLMYGVIKEFTNNAGLHVYYYAPGIPNALDYQTREGLTDYTQLFATDIILLGSLNNCDLDNLPKTFDSLPSSTANLPFIATLNGGETGDGVITGLDWGHNGEKSSFKYSEGLLMDLTCWTVYTRYKSCVNLSRLSELYVSLDMDMQTDEESEPSVVHDGMITSEELVENETRAKFASLNHNGLNNLVKNITTNYDTYKFHYIYPISFDGHLGDLKKYQKVKKNKNLLTDTRDSNYVMYRLGEGKDSLNNTRHKKHFYIGNESQFQFPLYNNSFYFYFGLKEGKTSIDKFNTLFNAACTTRNKYAFTIEYISKPGKWCYDTKNFATDFGTIDIEFNGLTDVFSYSLYNEFNELLIEETEIQSPDLHFGYDIKKGGGSYILTNDGYKKDGRLKEFKTGNIVKNVFDEPIYLENGVYFLEVTNSFGLKVTQKINMIQNTISPNFEEIRLGTKYKNLSTKVEDICGEMDYYGELRIKSFIIDGEEAFIKNVSTYFIDGVEYVYEIEDEVLVPENGKVFFKDSYYEEKYENGEVYLEVGKDKKDIYKPVYVNDVKEVTCKVQCTDGSEIYLILEPEDDETQNIENFVCYGVGNIPTIRMESVGEGIYTLIFNIWKPGDYVLTSNQICNNLMNDNFSVNTFSIENGEHFQAYINGIPMNVIYNDNFNTHKEDETFPRSWLQLENPIMYNFPSTKIESVDFWDDFLPIQLSQKDNEGNKEEFISIDSKIDILNFEISTISKMRDMAYIMGEEKLPQISITTIGGKEPILIRSIHPNYASITEENEYCDEVIIENNNTLELPLNYPFIIDRRYQAKKWWVDKEIYKKIRLNDTIYSPLLVQNLGNYFAAFTNNGGVVSLIDGTPKYDPSLFVESSPQKTLPLIGYSTTTHTLSLSYPPSILNTSTNTQGYFRSLSLDKRLIISGDLWAPVYCNYTIDENDNGDWKIGRWPCSIFNIAPMVYDDDYNIIGEKLSYDFKKIIASGKTEVFGTTDKYSAKCSFDDATQEYTLSGTFLKQRDLTVQGKTEEELLEKIMNVYDNNICNPSLTIGKDDENKLKITLTYDELGRVTKKEDFESDIDIKLVSNLMWVSNLGSYKNNKHYMRNTARLFKCTIDIDGVEFDERQSFKNFMYGSEKNTTNQPYEYVSLMQPVDDSGLDIVHGKHLSVEIANCRMDGNLSYEVTKNETEDEIYTFKSYVESADVIKEEFDIGERMNVVSASILYQHENSGEYFIWNNEKIFLKEIQGNKKYYVYKETVSDFNDYENEKHRYILEKNGVHGENPRLDKNFNQERTKGPLVFNKSDGNEIGYFWVKRQYLYMSVNEFKELLKIYNTQDILNRYGIPIYTMLYASVVTIKNRIGTDGTFRSKLKAQIRGLYYSFNPYDYKEDYRAESLYYYYYYQSMFTPHGYGYQVSYEGDDYESKPWMGFGGHKYKHSSESAKSGYTYDYYYLTAKMSDPNSEDLIPLSEDVNDKKCMIFIITAEEFNNMSSIFDKKGWDVNGNNYQRIIEKNGYFYPINGTITASDTAEEEGDDENFNVNLSGDTISLPTLINVNVNTDDNITGYSYDLYTIYKVSSTIQKDEEIYLMPYFYLRINSNDKKFDEKYLIPVNSFKGDGETILIDNEEYVIEENELQRRVYLRKDENYYLLEYIYIKYEKGNKFINKELKDESGNTIERYEYYCEKNNIKFEEEKNIIFKYGIEPWIDDGDDLFNGNDYTAFIEKQNIIFDDTNKTDKALKLNISQIPLVGTQRECYINITRKFEIVKKGEKKYIQIDGNEYEIFKSNLNQLSVKNVEDFSCKINKDEFNSTHSFIDGNAPFLSSAIIKNYGFKQRKHLANSLDTSTATVPEWEVGDNSRTFITNRHPRNEVNGEFGKSNSIFTYNNKTHSCSRYLPQVNSNDELLNKNGNIIDFSANGGLFIQSISEAQMNSGYDTKDGNFIKLSNKWWYIGLLNTIANSGTYYKANVNTYILLCPGKYQNKVFEDKYSGTTITILGETFNNSNDFKKAMSGRAQTILSQIVWDSKSHSEYLALVENKRNKSGIDSHRSLMDKANVNINEINVQTFENNNETKYYFLGNKNIRNIFEENKRPGAEFYGNCNLVGSTPWIRTSQTYYETDKEADNKYRRKTPIIGEMYVYYDRYIAGNFDENDYFVIEPDTNEREYFYRVSRTGRQYGKYDATVIKSDIREDVLEFVDFSGSTVLKNTYGLDYNERMGIKVIIPYLNKYGDSWEEINEAHELYDNLLYVYQPNTREDIMKGTEIISCNFVRTYYDDNKDYRFKVCPLFNQSSSFHVGPIFVGNVSQKTEKDSSKIKCYLPFFLTSNVNQDVKNGLIGGNIKFYFNGKEYNYSNLLYGNSDDLQKYMIFYSNYYANKILGYSFESNILESEIKNGYAKRITKILNKEVYLMDYTNKKLKNGDSLYKQKLCIYRKDEKAPLETKKVLQMKCMFGSIRANEGLNFAKQNCFTAQTMNEDTQISSFLVYNRFQISDSIILEYDIESHTNYLPYPFSFSLENGDKITNEEGEIKKVSLIDFDTLKKYSKGSKVTPFSSVWEVRGAQYLYSLPIETLKRLEASYNSGTTLGNFMVLILQEIYKNDKQLRDEYLKETGKDYNETFIKDSTLNEFLRRVFYNRNNNLDNKYVITINLPRHLYNLRDGSVAYADENNKNAIDEKGRKYTISAETVTDVDTKQSYNEYFIKLNDNSKSYAISYLIINDIRELEVSDPYDYVVGGYDSIDGTQFEIQDFFDITSFFNQGFIYEINNNEYMFDRQKGDITKIETKEKFINNLRDATKTEPIILYDRDMYKYLVKYAGSDDENNEKIIKFRSNIINDEEKIMKCTYRSSKFLTYNSEDIFKNVEVVTNLDDLRETTESINSAITYYASWIGVPCAIAEVSVQQVFEIICDDGYTFIGLSEEKITCVDNHGDKNDLTFRQIMDNGALGLFVYHFTKVDGIFYEFISKIKDIKNITSDYALELSFEGLKNDDRVVLSIEVNKIIHKLPFIYNNNNLIPFD